MRRLALLVPLCFVALAVAASPVSARGGRPFTLTMTGGAEVPGPGDPDGIGTAQLTFSPGSELLCYDLTVDNLDAVTAAHVHKELPGEEFGPPLIDLVAPTGGHSSDCTFVSRQQQIEIFRNLDEYYVNVHTETFPNGAIRGNLG